VAASAPASAATGGGRYGNGGDYGTTPSASAKPSASAASGPETYEVDKATGSVGAYLTGEGGMTLYTLKSDSMNTSACAGTCATNWPPFTAADDDTLTPGSGVGGKLTTFARADGTKQVAYNGQPLYYFSGDSAPGDTNGQGVKNVWYVAAP
jgi:predicted lipoprotein with Yx(FWY)xxD motif